MSIIRWITEGEMFAFAFSRIRTKKNRAKNKIISEDGFRTSTGYAIHRHRILVKRVNATITQSLLANSTLVASIEKKESKKRENKERKKGRSEEDAYESGRCAH